MKILCGIPVLTGPEHCRQAIESVIHQPDVDVLIIDNGAAQDVKDMLQEYENTAWNIIRNPVNGYVNRAWDQIIMTFLMNDEHDYLCIQNSDLIMCANWSEVCRNRWKVDPDEILLPIMRNDFAVESPEVTSATWVTEGTPGVFITLNRKQAELVYPIPEEIRVWFGDNFIFERLRKNGYKTLIPDNLFALHYWSSTVSAVPGIYEIIEQDKIAWETIKHRI